jgi:hypothetical protein
MRMQCAVIGLFLVGFALSGVCESTEEAAPAYDPEDWKPQIASVRDQLELLGLFSRLTALRPMKVKVPGEVQRLPLETIEGMESLANTGIEVYLKEVWFSNIRIDSDPEPIWLAEHPAMPCMLHFDKLGFNVDVKTRVGRFPVGGEFFTGRLPFDFDLLTSGYALSIIPERRSADAELDRVKVDLGGPVASGVLSRFFGKRLAQEVLKLGVGQSLKLDKNTLLGGEDLPSSILNQLGISTGGEDARGLLDSLLR